MKAEVKVCLELCEIGGYSVNIRDNVALKDVEEKESRESIDTVLKELAIHAEKIPADPLKGEWI